jgi:outer membrane lipoprotein-sorting protein
MTKLSTALLASAVLAFGTCSSWAQVTVNPDAIAPADKPAAKPKPAKPAANKPAPVKPKPAKPPAKPAAKPKPAVQVAPRPAPIPPPAAAAAAPALAPAATAMAAGPERDRVDLQRVAAALNAVRTLKGGFVQVGPNGEMENGTVYVNKPGRMRFEYAKPSPYLIVADGVSVAVGNSELKTVDRYPLIDNPLSLILDDVVDLEKNQVISRIERKPGQLVVTAKRDDGSLKGQVTLIFTEPAMELKQWVVTDAQGLQTMITLQGVETGVSLNPELFILRDVNKFADPREQ